MDPVESSPYFRDSLNNFSWSNFIDFKNSTVSKLKETETNESIAEKKLRPLTKINTSKNKMRRSMAAGSRATNKMSKDLSLNDNSKEAKKRKMDRFDGMSEEAVLKLGLPDHLAANLDILIIGINPGMVAAHVGHHYAGPGNHFWQCMYLSGLVSKPFTAYDDWKLLEYGIGFTNLVDRTTRSSADLTRNELKKGVETLRKKLILYKPKIAVFNGKVIYEVFSGKKDFFFGKQEELIDGTETIAFVMPSSSARCAQLPRAADKVPFFEGLKKLRDFVCGHSSRLDTQDVIFPKLTSKMKNDLDNPESALPKSETVSTDQEGGKSRSRRKASTPKKKRKYSEEVSSTSDQEMLDLVPMQEPSSTPSSFSIQQEPNDPALAEESTDNGSSHLLKQETSDCDKIMDYSLKRENSDLNQATSFSENPQKPIASQDKEKDIGMASKFSMETESFPSLPFIKQEPFENSNTSQQEPEDLSHSLSKQDSPRNGQKQIKKELVDSPKSKNVSSFLVKQEQIEEPDDSSLSKTVPDSSPSKKNESHVPMEDDTVSMSKKFTLTTSTEKDNSISSKQGGDDLSLPPVEQSSNQSLKSISELSDINSLCEKGKDGFLKNEFTSNPASSLSSNFTIGEQERVMAQFSEISQATYRSHQQQIPEDLSCSLQSNLFGTSQASSRMPQLCKEASSSLNLSSFPSIKQESNSPAFFSTAGLGPVPKLFDFKQEGSSSFPSAPPATHQTQPLATCHPEDLSFSPPHLEVVTNT